MARQLPDGPGQFRRTRRAGLAENEPGDRDRGGNRLSQVDGEGTGGRVRHGGRDREARDIGLQGGQDHAGPGEGDQTDGGRALRGAGGSWDDRRPASVEAGPAENRKGGPRGAPRLDAGADRGGPLDSVAAAGAGVDADDAGLAVRFGLSVGSGPVDGPAIGAVAAAGAGVDSRDAALPVRRGAAVGTGPGA